SDLKATLSEVLDFPTETRGLDRVLGTDPVPIALFKMQKGSDEAATHMAMANLPRVPNIIPAQDQPASPPQPALPPIHSMVPRSSDPKTHGRFGEIAVLAIQDPPHSFRHHVLYSRVYGRAKEGGRGELRASGPLTSGKPIVAFGGTPNMPMTISFSVDG